MSLIELAIVFRTLNLYAHHSHNMCKGKTFFEDHNFFAELYELADDFYDELIERHIGTINDKIDLCDVVYKAYKLLEDIEKSGDDYFKNSLILLEECNKEIDKMCKNAKISMGTQNLLQGQADKIEVLIYKLKRKLK